MTQPSARPPFPPPHPQVLPGYVRPPRRPVGFLVAGLAGLVATGLTLGGSFLAIEEVQRRDATYSQTWWGIDGPPEAEVTGDTWIGLSLVLATLLLLAGAVLAFSRLKTATRLLLALGVAFLAGTMFLQTMYTLHDLSLWNDVPLEPGESLEFTAGLGLWLPILGVVFGVVALVFAYLGGPARVEPSTPRMGFPMPYGPMTGAQPAVGHPMPAGPPAPVTPGAAAAARVAGAAPDAPTVAPPASSSTSDEDDPETTLRTTVTEAPTETPTVAPAPAAPSVAPDAPTEIPDAQAAPPADSPAADVVWTQEEPEPAAEDSTAEPGLATDIPTTLDTSASADTPATPDTPAATDTAAAPPADDSATDREAPAEPPSATPEAPGATEEAAPVTPPADSPPAPEPGESNLLDLPAAPPAPELADEQEDSDKRP